MLDRLEVRPGERFKSQVNGAEFEIVKIENSTAIVKDIRTGKNWQYGVDALKRLKVVKL